MSDTGNEQPQAAAAVAAGLTAWKLLADLQLVSVRDDGSCWVYAALACLGVLDHARISSSEEEEEAALDTNVTDAEASSEPKAKKRKRKTKKKKKSARDGIAEPSDRDMQLDYTIRHRLYDNQRERLGKDDDGEVLVVPTDDSLGSFGGYTYFSCLAVELRVDIAVYDEKTKKGLNDPSRKWILLSSSGEELPLTAGEIKERMDEFESGSQGVPVLHVAVSRVIPEHYEAYRYKGGSLDDTLSSYEFPSWFQDFERNWKDLGSAL